MLGRLPVKLFKDSFSDTRLVRLPTLDGTLLPRLFVLRSRAVRPVSKPIAVGIDPPKADPATEIDTTTELEHTTADHADVDGPVQMLPEFGTPAVHCHDENADFDVALNAADNAHIPIASLLKDTGELVGGSTGVAENFPTGAEVGMTVGLADGEGHTGVVPKRPNNELSFVRHDA